ncbi:MAG: hypothetical protein K2N55_13065 [Lachnospiraceae bacterium]|nr:hypothetical protein [Lachnospiraceae bacterium]
MAGATAAAEVTAAAVAEVTAAAADTDSKEALSSAFPQTTVSSLYLIHKISLLFVS